MTTPTLKFVVLPATLPCKDCRKENRRKQQQAGSNDVSAQSASGVVMSANVPQTPAEAADTRSDVVAGTAVKAEPTIKSEKKHSQCEHEAMDTNNNNNLEREGSMVAETPSKGRWESPAFSDISQIPITPGLQEAPASAKIPQSRQNGDTSFTQGKQNAEQNGRHTSNGRIGPSPFGLISPDFPNITGTPTSVSQLLTLPSSAFSLEGLEFPSPIGSGQFSPLASARLGRKRALSISPLSSSSLDLNSLIRTSPTSLVNYIANSRGSSAGSIGHLSPSLFSNPALFQSRPMQVSLRNANYPLQNTATAAQNKEKTDFMTDMSQVRIKKEERMETSQSSTLIPGSCSPASGTTRNPMLLTPSDPLFQNSGLATVQEEPPGMLGSSEDEGMYAEPTDYSSAITENECEIDRKPVLGLDKPKRVYYSYPSVEEPHNNQCRWSNCDKNCDSLEDLVRHVNSDHIYRDSRKDFICYWSGCVRKMKPFKAQYMLLVHMRRHTGEKPHKCTVGLPKLLKIH